MITDETADEIAPHGAEGLDTVEQAIADIAAGRAIVVVDDASRENEGDIVFAASKATPELLAFTIRYARGLICVPMLGEDLDRLQLPPMTSDNQEHMGTAFTISVDARDGITTGISAADRARTIRTLVDSATEPYEIVRPGHVFPLRYASGGVLRRAGHTEAAVDLARLAGLTPAGVVAEIFNDDGTMARRPQLRAFADQHGLTLISIAQLIEHRRHSERTVRRVVQTRVPNQFGEWRAFGYLNAVDGTEHVALVLGDLDGPAGLATAGEPDGVLVRMHSECLTGDVFGSERCDCGAQLTAAMATIAAEGRGVVLYLRGHEGRGIGLLSKLRAYQLQDNGADTVDANLELGLPADAREYSTGAQMLADLGVRSLRLLTNNPDKVRGLSGFGIEVTGRVPLPVAPTPDNLRYLIAKRDRLGHHLGELFIQNGTPRPARAPGQAGPAGPAAPAAGSR
jgi:3,4-dihydroxy 2-butanone 4-phosphate synthase / GTP cyclohydrolase II